MGGKSLDSVDMNSAKDGSTPAPQEASLAKAPVPVIGSAFLPSVVKR